MRRILAVAGLFVMVSGVSLAQPAAGSPSFEVASIKPAAPMEHGRVMVRMGGDPGRIDYTNVSLKDVLTRAYGVKRHQINGPSWLDSERFDITAKIPEGVSRDQIPVMLQNLMAERFKMTAHKETKDQPVYALIVGKNGPKLKKASETDDGNFRFETPGGGGGPLVRESTAVSGGGARAAGGPPPPPPPGAGAGGGGARAMMMIGGNGRMQVRKATLGNFADMLSNMLDRPVVDMTGVEGNYDIDLEVSMEEMVGMRRMGGAVAVMHGPGPGGAGGEGGPAPESAPSASIFSAVQQLGLKLDPRKAPIEFVVIDKMEKVPTEN
jgi:uncharacterized protein (TIGR03435 family)